MGLADEKEVSSSADQTQEKLSGYDREREEANRRRVWNSRRVRALSEVRKKRLADEEHDSSSADQTQEKLSGYDRESEIQSRRSEADRRRVRNSGELREIQ